MTFDPKSKSAFLASYGATKISVTSPAPLAAPTFAPPVFRAAPNPFKPSVSKPVVSHEESNLAAWGLTEDDLLDAVGPLLPQVTPLTTLAAPTSAAPSFAMAVGQHRGPQAPAAPVPQARVRFIGNHAKHV
jgi:hypothetical protein